MTARKPAENGAVDLDALLKDLGKKFPANQVRQREQDGRTLDYIAIDTTILRYLEVLGWQWDFEGMKVEMTGPHTRTRRRRRRGEFVDVEVDLWSALVAGHLVVYLPDGRVRRHLGVGADYAEDADKVVKTALAEAIKKGGHQLGVGLYLWSAEERAAVEQLRQVGNDPRKLMGLLVKRASDAGAVFGDDPDANRKVLAEWHEVKVEDLGDVDVLQKLAGVVS